MFFEAKVKHVVTTETGKQKVVVSAFLVDGVSFTDVETQLVGEMSVMGGADHFIASISRSKIEEVIPLKDLQEGEEEPTRFRAVTDETEDDGEKKKVYHSHFLVEARNPEDVPGILAERYRNTTMSWDVSSIRKTTIEKVIVPTPVEK